VKAGKGFRRIWRVNMNVRELSEGNFVEVVNVWLW